MNRNSNEKDSIVEFIDEEAFYTFRKNKSEIEKGTLAIYIYATLSLLSFILFLTVNRTSPDWFSITINILVLVIYYFLAAYSSHEPYNAFISTICAVGLVLLTDLLFTSQFTIKGVILKIVLIVFLSLKLQAARNVQTYNKARLNKP